MAISSALIGGLLVTAYSIQRSFLASQHHILSQSQQLRLLDYMNLDLRRALTVKTETGRLTVTIPDFYDENGYPREPVIARGSATYGPNPVKISYYRDGDIIYREEGSTKQALASDVSDFQFTLKDLGQSISVSFTFLPKFQFNSANEESVRQGTATYTTTLLRNKRQN